MYLPFPRTVRNHYSPLSHPQASHHIPIRVAAKSAITGIQSALSTAQGLYSSFVDVFRKKTGYTSDRIRPFFIFFTIIIPYLIPVVKTNYLTTAGQQHLLIFMQYGDVN